MLTRNQIQLVQDLMDEILDEEGRQHFVREQPRSLAPDVGETFKLLAKEPWNYMDHGYRVTGWFRVEGTREIHCTREEATHVGGSGVAGIIVRVDKIRIDGRVSWPEEHIEEERQRALHRVGQVVF
jgi:hypothetical protein